jgi:hypothetical protein
MTTALDHVAEFERAWADPNNTAVDVPPVDVNAVLRANYLVDPELTYTTDMLWDMEMRKAKAPDVYIPSVVRPHSARVWPGATPEEFTRVSDQRLWLRPETYQPIIEHVRFDQVKRSVYFLGAAAYTSSTGETLRAGSGQPLFHVEHWVEGEPDRPLNRWRIVLLTNGPDPALVDVFNAFGARRYLPDFVEVHITDVLGRTLERKN